MEVVMIKAYFTKWYETTVFVAGHALGLAIAFFLAYGLTWSIYYMVGDHFLSIENYNITMSWLSWLWVSTFNVFLCLAIPYMILQFFLGDYSTVIEKTVTKELSPQSTGGVS